jgi:hypothetical protein
MPKKSFMAVGTDRLTTDRFQSDRENHYMINRVLNGAASSSPTKNNHFCVIVTSDKKMVESDSLPGTPRLSHNQLHSR